MPVHDWTRVEAGIFHAFHHGWIEEIARALNRGVLPQDYYALPEQHAGGFGPDVLTLQGKPETPEEPATNGTAGRTTALLNAPPKFDATDETDMEFYRRKQTSVAIRHVSGDRVVAMIEIVSPGNKSTRHALRSFLEKAAELLDQRIHLLIADLLPPGRHEPHGIHAAVWEEIAGKPYIPPPGCVQAPMESTYQLAFVAMPQRWRKVMEEK
jgi:hypothetical protein